MKSALRLRTLVVPERTVMGLNATLLRDSFDLVCQRQSDVAARFYDTLFSRYPQVVPMFRRADRSRQERMLTDALVALMDHLEDSEWLDTALPALGARHASYGVTDEMYGWVGECLLATLAGIAGDVWSAELATAWCDAYGAVSGLMLRGAHAPAYADPGRTPSTPTRRQGMAGAFSR
jgi:hemoglobin-like flavoprotein